MGCGTKHDNPRQGARTSGHPRHLFLMLCGTLKCKSSVEWAPGWGRDHLLFVSPRQGLGGPPPLSVHDGIAQVVFPHQPLHSRQLIIPYHSCSHTRLCLPLVQQDSVPSCVRCKPISTSCPHGFYHTSLDFYHIHDRSCMC